jgi:hypothetical protein
MLTCCIIKEMHCAFQMRHAILIRTNEFLVGPHELEHACGGHRCERKVYFALGAHLLRLGASFSDPLRKSRFFPIGTPDLEEERSVVLGAE